MQAKINTYLVDGTNRLILNEPSLIKCERLIRTWPIPTNLVCRNRGHDGEREQK